MKNKGYYGWIHSLNEAGVQAQRNEFEILTEQRSYNGEMLNEAYKPNRSEAGMAAKKARSLVDSEKRRAAKAGAAESAAKAASSGEGELSDFDFSGFQDRAAQIKNEKAAIGDGVQRVETGYHGGDVADDSYDPTDPDSGTEEVPYGRLPSFPWAHDSKPTDIDRDGDADAEDVRLDASDNIIGNQEEPEDEGKYEFPTKNWKTVKESVSQKISRMLRN
jgi:hypothetical protein